MTHAELIAKVREIAQQGLEGPLCERGYTEEGEAWVNALEEIVRVIDAEQDRFAECVMARTVELIEPTKEARDRFEAALRDIATAGMPGCDAQWTAQEALGIPEAERKL